MQREQLKELRIPDQPGVYFFRGAKQKILYIGKAASLRDRVRSYFSPDLIEGRGARIVAMVQEAQSLDWQTTDSVLEALILEANLIKEHQPPYNVDEKDNKSFNYLVVTREDFPRIFIMRGRELFGPQGQEQKFRKVFGPFPHGGSLKEALKLVRRIFPFRDSCVPQSGKPCFNRQIGLCPGVCTGEMSEREYKERVSNIEQLFGGNFRGLKRDLARQMKAAAKDEEFEKAATLRRQIESLEHVRDVSLIKEDFRVASGGGVRIEAFDVAHTAGEETVAVMTVVTGGEAAKAAYRKFTIRSATNNDVASLKEALSRRLAHAEWPLPRLFVVDGSSAQLNAARRVLRDLGIQVPVVGVVKNERHRPERLVGDQRSIAAHEKDILLANAEAHRFAISWHRKRRNARSLRR
jgi:excinuclease ABC subunit C